MDDEWLNIYERLTRIIKAREEIVGRFKGAELPSFQGTQYYEEDLVVRDRVPSRTERPLVRETDTNGNHVPIGQAQNTGYSANIQ